VGDRSADGRCLVLDPVPDAAAFVLTFLGADAEVLLDAAPGVADRLPDAPDDAGKVADEVAQARPDLPADVAEQIHDGRANRVPDAAENAGDLVGDAANLVEDRLQRAAEERADAPRGGNDGAAVAAGQLPCNGPNPRRRLKLSCAKRVEI